MIDPEFYFQRSLTALQIDDEVIENISESEAVPHDHATEDENQKEEH